MSLDVDLSGEETEAKCECDSCGHEHTRKVRENLFSANITHNLITMANAAGIYKHLWRPDEIGVTKAAQLIEPLTAGLALLEGNPERFRHHNPKNGWGSYEGLVKFVRNYLVACRESPEATVSVAR